MNLLKKSLIFYHYYRYIKLNENKIFDSKNNNENKIIQKLKKNKFVVIRNFISKKECKKIINEVKNSIKNKKIKNWSDNFNSDNRIFGAEYISNKINNFAKNKKINNIGSTYIGQKLSTFMVMANQVTFKKNNLGSGGGWHRDSFKKQFKAILYLNDVSLKNGPFELIPNSSDLNFQYNMIFKFNRDIKNNRFTNSEIEKILKYTKSKSTKITGKAGTLILVDTSTIHRGNPLKSSSRLALTNYMYPKYKFHFYNNKFKPRLKNKVFR